MGRQRGGSGRWLSSSPTGVDGPWLGVILEPISGELGVPKRQLAAAPHPRAQSPHSWMASSACRSQLPAALGETDVATGVGSKDIKASPEFKMSEGKGHGSQAPSV